MAGAIAAATLLSALIGATPELRASADVAALVRTEITPRLDSRLAGQLQDVPLVVSAERSLFLDPLQRRGKSFSLSYLLAREDSQFALRAGYRFGLPLDVPDHLVLKDTLVLTSGGTVRVSVGTVTWLQVDLEAFKELAGARVLRLDAVPGFRVRVSESLPLDAGGGLVVSTKTENGVFQNRTAGVLHFGGRF